MVTAVTRIQYVSSPDGRSALRKDLYSPERQRRPGQLDEPQIQIPCKDLVSDDHRDKNTGNRWFFCTIWLCCSLELNCWFRLARGELAPRLSLVSPKVFSPFCHRWSFGSLPLSPLACLVEDTSFTAISLSWLQTIAQILFKLNWDEWWHHWIQWWTAFNCHFALLTHCFPN